MPSPRFGHPYFPHLDPERRWLFRLEFSLTDIGLGGTDVLTINAQQVVVPTVNINPVIIPHLNQDVKFAGRPTLGPMTVLFLTAYNRDAIAVLEDWHHRVFRPSTEALGTARSYKATATLVVLTVGDPPQEFKQYKILGCFPVSIGDRDYDWAANDHVVRQAVFEVDKVLAPNDRNDISSIPALPF